MGRVKVVFEAQTSRTYFRRVEQAIYQAVGAGLERTLIHGERVAKKNAPVRKVTRQGGRAQTRDLTDAEIGDLPDFARKGINPVTGRYLVTGKRPQTTVKRSLASRPEPAYRVRGRTKTPPGRGARELDFSKTGELSIRHPITRAALSSQGNAELERGQRAIDEGNLRAVRRTGVHIKLNVGGQVSSQNLRATLGGRLRDEITSILDKVGVISEGRLLSPTEYARFVEFPTSRTAAQPYMRPARSAMASRLRQEIESALQKVEQFVGGGGFR